MSWGMTPSLAEAQLESVTLTYTAYSSVACLQGHAVNAYSIQLYAQLVHALLAHTPTVQSNYTMKIYKLYRKIYIIKQSHSPSYPY